MHPEKSAFITSSILVTVLAVVGGGYYASTVKQESTQIEQPVVERQEVEVFSEDTLATIGQQYIKHLSFMEDYQHVPILLESIQEVDHDKWLAKYFLNMSDMTSYFIEAEIMSGRVTEHSVVVADKKKTVTLSEPEPTELISAKQFVVKGETKTPGFVTITIYTPDQQKLKEYTFDQTETATKIFAQNIQTSDFTPGEYLIEISVNDVTLVYPIVISRYAL